MTQCIEHAARIALGIGGRDARRADAPTRPVPTNPVQPVPTFNPSWEDNLLNGNFSFSRTSRGRVRSERESICWACSCGNQGYWCYYCAAPPWNGNITTAAVDGPGVYILQADCGLAKIGVSKKSVYDRADHLIRTARRHGSECHLVAVLEGAGHPVEHWLHETLVESRDPKWAGYEDLPHPSEWFWPTPALRALVAGDDLVDFLHPHDVEPWNVEPDGSRA